MSQTSPSSVRILVVDDETDMEFLIREKFRRQILENIYQFEFAYCGLEALSKINDIPDIGIILTDIKMPRLDGLSLLSRLKELKKQDLKTIIISAYGDIDNIRIAMNRGAFDFIIKPVDFDDLEITLNKTLEEIGQIRTSMEEHNRWIAAQSDLTITRKIQLSLLPRVFPPFPEHQEFDIFASILPAREISGDFFDFFMIDTGRMGFVIGDVSGKGVPAVIYMAICRTLIRATGLKGVPASECIYSVNNLLCRESASSMFVTVFYGILNVISGEVDYVNTGRNTPFLLSSAGITRVERTEGSSLGTAENLHYGSGKILLNPYDKLFLFNKGLTGAVNAEGTAFGEMKLESFLGTSYNFPVETIVRETINEVFTFMADTPLVDDITLLSVGYNG